MRIPSAGEDVPGQPPRAAQAELRPELHHGQARQPTATGAANASALFAYLLGPMDNATVDQQKPELATSTGGRQDRPNNGIGI